MTPFQSGAGPVRKRVGAASTAKATSARRTPGKGPASPRDSQKEAAARSDGTVKLSVNVAEGVGEQLRQLAFEQRLSESSIVEVALTLLFGRGEGASLGNLLRQKGASLRRKRKGA